MKTTLAILGAFALMLSFEASARPAGYHGAAAAAKSGPREWPPTNPLTGSVGR